MPITDKNVGSLTIRRIHSPDGRKTFGFIVGVPDENGNMPTGERFTDPDAVSAYIEAEFSRQHEAAIAAIHAAAIAKTEEVLRSFKRTKIDRIADWTINKLTDQHQIIRGYEAVHLDGDAPPRYFDRLGDARRELGAPLAAAKLTAPKSSYKQNQTGYDPHR